MHYFKVIIIVVCAFMAEYCAIALPTQMIKGDEQTISEIDKEMKNDSLILNANGTSDNETTNNQQSTEQSEINQTTNVPSCLELGSEQSESTKADELCSDCVLPEMRLVVSNNKTWEDVIAILLQKNFGIFDICDNLKNHDKAIIEGTSCTEVDLLGVRIQEGFGDFTNDKEIMKEVELLTETLPACRMGFRLNGKYCKRLIVFKFDRNAALKKEID